MRAWRLRGPIAAALGVALGVALVVIGTQAIPFAVSFAVGTVRWSTYEVVLVMLGGLATIALGSILLILGGLEVARAFRVARGAAGANRATPSGVRTSAVRVAAVSIVAVIGLVAASLVVWTLIQGPPTATIALADSRYTLGRCVNASGEYAQEYDWSFRLVNTGTEDGMANVTFLVDNVSVAETAYFVPHLSSMYGYRWVYGPIRTSGCVSETPSLRITKVTTLDPPQ